MFVLVDDNGDSRRSGGDGILGGIELASDFPELTESLLVCTTETKTAIDLDRYVKACNAARAEGAR